MNQHSHLHRATLLLLTTLLCAPSLLLAQSRPNDPHLAYAFPAGCQQGTTREIVIGGQHLKDVADAYITGSGATVEIGQWYRPLSQNEFNDLRTALDDARKKLVEGGKAKPTNEEVAKAANITEVQLREIEKYRERSRDEKRQLNEQLEEELILKVTFTSDAEPGKRELRLLTETAMSNPLWIQVGKYPEVMETEPNDDQPDAAAITQFPVVVNGQIMPGETDSFSFEAKKGMRLVIVAGARDVIPYLADAVPGWFQAVLKLTDSSGKEISYASSYYFSQDPVIYFEVPKDDRYTVVIHDALYRGREDFVYRLTLGEIPIVTSIFPLGVSSGEKTTVALKGWNLTTTTLESDRTPYRQYRPLRWQPVEQGAGHVVQVPLLVDTLPEVFDKEPNNDQETAQRVPARAIINGRIDTPGDEDVYFVSSSGRLAVEVRARRHGSPLDSMISVTDAQGKEVAFNDDFEDKAQSLMTHHADSHLVFNIPSSGAYIRISDTQGNGGEDFVYRLYLRAPQPDYELRVTPASIIGRAGAITPITVYALREDNFTDDIELKLVDPPPGFFLSGGIIPGNADQVQLTLTMPPTPPEGPVVLNMVGSALGKGKQIRPAVPAENMMQAFIWHHLIPVENWSVIVSGKPAPKPPYNIIMTGPRLLVQRGGTTYLPIQPINKNVSAGDVQISLSEPKGITAKVVTNNMGTYAIEVTGDAEQLEAGLRGNLLFYAYRTTTPAPTKENPNPQTRRTDFGYFPAISFEVVGQKSR